MDFQTNITKTISDLLNRIEQNKKEIADLKTKLETNSYSIMRLAAQWKELYVRIETLENRQPEKVNLITLIRDLFRKK